MNPRPGPGPEDIHKWKANLLWIACDVLGPAHSWIPLLLDRVFCRIRLDLLPPTGPCNTNLDEATESCQRLHTIGRKRSVISIAPLIFQRSGPVSRGLYHGMNLSLILMMCEIFVTEVIQGDDEYTH